MDEDEDGGSEAIASEHSSDIWPGCCSAEVCDTNFVSHHPCESICSLKILLEGYTS